MNHDSLSLSVGGSEFPYPICSMIVVNCGDTAPSGEWAPPVAVDLWMQAQQNQLHIVRQYYFESRHAMRRRDIDDLNSMYHLVIYNRENLGMGCH